MKGFRARVDYLLKHNQAAQWLYTHGLSVGFRFLGLFVRTDERLVLLSAHGRGYNDSPRVLYEQMLSDPRCAHLRYIWALEDPESMAIEGCEKVKADTPKYFYLALKARYWITCVNIERGLHFKKKRTFYLNTWHGTPLKTIGNAAGGRKDYDFSSVDCFLCAGDYERNIFVRDMGVRPDALLCAGLPRNDALYRADAQAVADARQKLGVPDGLRVILYAPTWRDSADGGSSYQIAPPIDMAKWKARLSGKYLVLMRAHAYTSQLLGLTFDDFLRDATDYPCVNDLLLAADMLITDYSAILLDYAILERPLICFGYDYEAYRAARGLYLDLDQVIPGGVKRTEDEVLERITNMDYPAECRRTARLKAQYLTCGGHATQMCLDALMEDKR
ncbi:MAG: CDP-glycerol glycerophosphotransferase family protein [Clostridia bacterium]